MAKYTHDQIDRACELREQGLTYGRIAELVGMHPASVLEYCQANGAIAPKQIRTGVQGRLKVTSDEARRLTELRAAGLGPSQIARLIGWSEKAVRNRLRSLAFRQAVAEERGAHP